MLYLFFFSFALYSREGSGSLVLRPLHAAHFPLNSEEEWHYVLSNELQSDEMTIKYLISSSGNRTHNLSHLQSHMPLRHIYPQSCSSPCYISNSKFEDNTIIMTIKIQ